MPIIRRGGERRLDEQLGNRRMTTPKYPHISLEIDLNGPGGNTMAIIGDVARLLRQVGEPAAEINKYTQSAMSKDYLHVLTGARQWFDVTFLKDGEVHEIEEDEEE